MGDERTRAAKRDMGGRLAVAEGGGRRDGQAGLAGGGLSAGLWAAGGGRAAGAPPPQKRTRNQHRKSNTTVRWGAPAQLLPFRMTTMAPIRHPTARGAHRRAGREALKHESDRMKQSGGVLALGVVHGALAHVLFFLGAFARGEHNAGVLQELVGRNGDAMVGGNAQRDAMPDLSGARPRAARLVHRPLGRRLPRRSPATRLEIVRMKDTHRAWSTLR